MVAVVGLLSGIMRQLRNFWTLDLVMRRRHSCRLAQKPRGRKAESTSMAARDGNSHSVSNDARAPGVSAVSGKRKWKPVNESSVAATAPGGASAQALGMLIRSVQEASQASANRRGHLSDGSSAWGDFATDTKRKKQNRKPKPTTTLRKEKIAELNDEIDELKARLTYLDAQASRDPNHRDTGRLGISNTVLREVIQEHELSMANARSVISWFSANEWSVPAHCYIHLPRGLNDRYRALTAVKPRQLRLARRFVLERSRFLNLNVAHNAGEHFTKDNGDVCVVEFSLTQFPATCSAREVFEAASYFTACLEISLSDTAGQITIREEDTEFDDPTIMHNRFLTTVSPEVDVEGNVVLFTHCDDDEDFGLVVGTFVDHDDQYPYRPNERLRHDVTCIIMVSRERDHIVVRRFAYSLIHHNSGLAVDPVTVHNMSESIRRWSNAILAQMRAHIGT